MIIDRQLEKKKILDALAKDNIVIVTGPAGCGKTALVNQLSAECKWNYLLFNPLYIDKERYRNLNKDDTTDFIIFDEVNNAEDFLQDLKHSDIVHPLNKKIIITTREAITTSEFPVVHISPLNENEVSKILEEYNLSEKQLKLVYDSTKGNLLLVELFSRLLGKKLSFEKIMSALTDYQTREILEEYSVYKKSKEKTPREAREIMYQLINFGPLEIKKLKKWNLSKNINELITLLEENYFISTMDNIVYPTLKSLKFSLREEKSFIDNLLQVFEDNEENWFVSREDENILVDILSNINRYANYVSKINKKNMDYSTSEKEDIKELLREIRDNQSQQGNEIHQINETTTNTEKIALRNEKKLDELVLKSMQELEMLREAAIGDAEALSKIDELSYMVQNPKKYKVDEALKVLGALGSIASIAAVFDVSNLSEYISSIFH